MSYDAQTIQQEGRLFQEPEEGSGEPGKHKDCSGKAAQKDTVFIYVLCCPFTGEIRYLGKTIYPKKRLKDHMNDRADTHKAHWIKSLRDKGGSPVMEFIEVFTDGSDGSWQDAERFWISYLRFLGVRLTNIECGGHGGGRLSPETIAKMKLSKSGTRPSEKAMAARKEAMIGWSPSPEQRRRTSLRLRGRPRPIEVKARIAASKKGRKGTPMSEEMKLYFSELYRGRKNKPEWMAAQKLAITAKKNRNQILLQLS